MKPLLIIKTGTTIEGLPETRGDFENWIMQALDLAAEQCLVVRVYKGESLPDPRTIGALIITGSPAMVTDLEPWSEATATWLKLLAEQHTIPVLGICYGHQLLAHALGGAVANHPGGREMGTVQISLTVQATEDPLFKGMPGNFNAHVSHSQTVRRLPEGATVLAMNDFEPHQAVRFGQLIWGVQFHPEFDEEIMEAYITARRVALEVEGFEIEQLLSRVAASEKSTELLRRFLQIARSAHAI